MYDQQTIRRISETRQRIARSRGHLERRVSRDFPWPLRISSWLIRGRRRSEAESALPLLASLAAGWWFSRQHAAEDNTTHPLTALVQWALHAWQGDRTPSAKTEQASSGESK